MRPISDSPPADDDRRFDLLVDGELSEAERRELLTALDNEPVGWRRCALAFLEAQCWKKELGSLVGRSQSHADFSHAQSSLASSSPSVARPARRSWLSGRPGTLLAMAASFLAALFLGSYVQRAWYGSSGGSGLPVQAIVQGPSNLAPGRALGDSQGLTLAATGQPGAQSAPWETVTLTMPGGSQGGPQSIQLPAVARDNIDDAWLRSLPAAMPADVLQALKRTGHQVRQQCELLPLEMNDGRRLVVPVDQVELHYVGNPTY